MKQILHALTPGHSVKSEPSNNEASIAPAGARLMIGSNDPARLGRGADLSVYCDPYQYTVCDLSADPITLDLTRQRKAPGKVSNIIPSIHGFNPDSREVDAPFHRQPILSILTSALSFYAACL
jgi:hypothetical protein